MISTQVNIECLNKLGMLRFFPDREGVLVEISKFLNELCRSDQEARKLTDAVLARFSEWPGPAKLREIHAGEIGGSMYARWTPPVVTPEPDQESTEEWLNRLEAERKRAN